MFSSRHSVTRQGVVPRGVLRACRAAGRISTWAHGRGGITEFAFFWLLFQIVDSSPTISCSPQRWPWGLLNPLCPARC